MSGTNVEGKVTVKTKAARDEGSDERSDEWNYNNARRAERCDDSVSGIDSDTSINKNDNDNVNGVFVHKTLIDEVERSCFWRALTMPSVPIHQL